VLYHLHKAPVQTGELPVAIDDVNDSPARHVADGLAPPIPASTTRRSVHVSVELTHHLMAGGVRRIGRIRGLRAVGKRDVVRSRSAFLPYWHVPPVHVVAPDSHASRPITRGLEAATISKRRATRGTARFERA